MHVVAIYLGIAVLVTGVLGLTVPSLREQSRQMHDALLTALQPDSFSPDMSIWSERDQEEILTAVAVGDADLASPANFSQAVSVAADTLSIPGVTAAQAQALRGYIARKYKIARNVAGVLVKAAFIVGRENKLDPQLLLAVIAIESRYNPYAESHVGAQGLMQVMTRVHKEKFKPFAEGTVAALNPIANMRVGAQILVDCIKRRGSVKAGLGCYVGATGPSDGGYGEKVLAERRRIALASGVAPETGTP